jgi:hypothetical protein
VTITDGPAKDFPRTRTQVVECSTEPEEQEQYGPACGFSAVGVKPARDSPGARVEFRLGGRRTDGGAVAGQGPGQEFWIQLSCS